MKKLQTLAFDRERCFKEALQFRKLLGKNPTLSERGQVLPFFKQKKHLSGLIGSYNPKILVCDRLAHEYQLFGDFACDLVVGDSQRQAFAFVEFEEASPGSIFTAKGAKATPEWSPRFEHGFSQIVDWFFKLDEQRVTVEFEDRFGSRSITYVGLLIIGRNDNLGPREQERLAWRQERVLVHSKQVYCLTFDRLCEDLLNRLQMFAQPGTA